MLRLTGFVLVDVGVNVITAFAGKTDPAQVTPADMSNMASFLERVYSDPPGQSIASGLAFPNSGFSQHSWNGAKFRHKRRAYASFVLRGHEGLNLQNLITEMGKEDYEDMVLRGQSYIPPCAFSGDPAYLRVSREMVPMLNGRGIINFSRNGIAGVPVADWVLLAIHAMPLGCLISEGRLLAVDSDDAELVFDFARSNWTENQRYFGDPAKSGIKGLPNHPHFGSNIVNQLVKVASLPNAIERFEKHSPSLTAFHFSNYGEKPKIDIYALPSSVVRFVGLASHGRHSDVWGRLVSKAWRESKPKSANESERYNALYEDLLRLPESAPRFIKSHLLYNPQKPSLVEQSRSGGQQFSGLIATWDFTDFFLKEIIGMEQGMRNRIRNLGDKLAAFVSTRADKKFMYQLFRVNVYHEFRLLLLKVSKSSSSQNPILEYDEFVDIFESGSDYARMDWRLVRDLLLIRIYEQLHALGKLEEVVGETQFTDSDEDISHSDEQGEN